MAMRVKITWVETGTRNAACLGIDETVEADSLEQARQDALHYGDTAGIDLQRYEPAVEVTGSEYFRVVCSRESEMGGAGLGYEEVYGHEPRYFWSRPAANARAAELNNPPDDDSLSGTYSVQSRSLGDDPDDKYCQQQLGLSD